jgi:hypothetical protein
MQMMENREFCHGPENGHGLGKEGDGQQVRIKTELIPDKVFNRLARETLEATARAFEDPAVRADYERWKAERKNQQPDGCQK